jgi:succinyl-diaminopimelate desuccinylase
VRDALRDVGARDAGDTCVLAGTTERGDRPLLLLAGHLDTVPAQDNRPGRRDGDAVHGLGAADMKGAVAVMVELALSGLGERANVDVGYVFFGREELPVVHSALTPLLEREPGLRDADAVIVMEPTANAIHAGCLGNINALWTFRGTSGHSARPWLADNAIHRAAAGIDALAEVAHVNFRYAPGMSAEAAEALLRGWCEPYGSLEIESNAPSAPVATRNDLVQRLIAAGDLAVAPKQAWTPVAEFAAVGVDAVNFGPGDPRYAHTRDEQVAVEALVRSYETLERFACG